MKKQLDMDKTAKALAAERRGAVRSKLLGRKEPIPAQVRTHLARGQSRSPRVVVPIR